MQNIKNLELSTSANAQNNDDNNCGLWWDKLENLSNSNKIEAYSPRWNRSCTKCGTQLLPLEQKNFGCNAILERGIVNLQHPHAFTVNGCAYHQIHSANTEVNRIKQELEAINPFIQGLYQLRNVNYPQARLIIKQPTANAEIAAYTIVHSTAIMQE
ncbi:13646_t:CDS:2 [Gigaspora margarita]|uniref:13646_t:CDS:1 n=1 Tax=Gigaspora margarita TaxID=4874 RepID=A0ABN7W8X8_GIGMA|nr:13646_t:CDS:2 [Gigaspora margarita]